MIKDLNIGLLVSWNLLKYKDIYLTINVHYAYIKFLSYNFRKIYLITSIKKTNNINILMKYNKLDDFHNIEVIELPEVKSFAKSLLNFYKYYKSIKYVSPLVDLFYCRVPDPFSWMPVFLGGEKIIMHFVGDTIEATKYNEKWSILKKMFIIIGYLPEWHMTLLAAKKSCVYCNGQHLVKKLYKKGVKAKVVVSSTISYEDLPELLHVIPVKQGSVSILFLSYIRYSKGINCLMGLIEKLEEETVPYHFNIVGDGEMMPELKSFVESKGYSSHVTIHGYVNDRGKINQLMDNSDIFFFASLSEGSPRVIIEAASRGVPVVSTPVGSLPFAFKDGESIRFYPFNDACTACEIIKEFMKNPVLFVHLRNAAYNLVKEKYTSEVFMSKIFSYEP